jgi:hypothetical protein
MGYTPRIDASCAVISLILTGFVKKPMPAPAEGSPFAILSMALAAWKPENRPYAPAFSFSDRLLFSSASMKSAISPRSTAS